MNISPSVAAVLLSTLLTPCSGEVTPSKRARTPTKAELADIWIGLSDDSLYYYRCDLKQDSRGLLVQVFLLEKAYSLPIQEWSYHDRRIQIGLAQEAQSTSDIKSITGEATTESITLEIRGTNWRKTAHLRREREMNERAKIAKEASKD